MAGLAYGARRIGEALSIDLDLGVVTALTGAAAMLYAALLQSVAEGEGARSGGRSPTMPKTSDGGS